MKLKQLPIIIISPNVENEFEKFKIYKLLITTTPNKHMLLNVQNPYILPLVKFDHSRMDNPKYVM